MSTLSQPAANLNQSGGGKARTVQPCNFRTAGRLTNEDARTLTAMHDSFARQLSNTLDNYLSTAVEVKLLTVDQLTLKEYLDQTPFFLTPIALGIRSDHVMVECDSKLVLPMIELLMGGSGQVREEECELSEIDEEVMHDIVEIIADEAERTWRIPELAVTVEARIKTNALSRFCTPSEKLTLLKFGVKFAETSGMLSLLLPSVFVTSLLKQVKLDQPQKKSLWQFPKVPVRERVLDCEMEVAAELPGIKVAVRDLVSLQPESVLKLRAPIQTPGMLTAGGWTIFEAMPVRTGSQRAAQLGQRVSQPLEMQEREDRNG